jgi:uncharacterized repeat protein (TIGR03803 family)
MRIPLLFLVAVASVTVGPACCAVPTYAGTETALFTFDGADGGNPLDYGLLAIDSSGNLYGTTQLGGRCGNGTVFEISGETETVLQSFGCGDEGGAPLGSVSLDSSGNIYGSASTGGGDGCGTVFELSNHQVIVLYSFTCGNDGGAPSAGVLLDASGNIFGTASFGANKSGVVYEISKNGKYSVLYNFCSAVNCADGAFPQSLAMDQQGNLYGMTYQGGSENLGTVFELSPVGGAWKETVLHSFAGGASDGAHPEGAGLVVSVQLVGNQQQTLISGTTLSGGVANKGTAFQLAGSTSGYSFTLLHTFGNTSRDGAYPTGTLTTSAGNFFGTTTGGGSWGWGCVFELVLNNGGWMENVLYSFTGYKDGSGPTSGVLPVRGGKLVGVTTYGGDGKGGRGNGLVYEVIP